MITLFILNTITSHTMIKTLKKNILVPPRKFFYYQQFISDELNEMANKNYSDKHGFLQKIVGIKEINNQSVYTNDFTGSVVYSVIFEAEFINPQIGEEIECEIEHNMNIVLAKADNMKIIIVEDDHTKELKVGDKVMINIKLREVSSSCNYIKLVGDYVRKIN